MSSLAGTSSTSPLVIRTEPLTPEGFAPFGSVIMAARGDVVGKPANQGTAKRYNWLGEVENLRAGAAGTNATGVNANDANAKLNAKLNLCVFRCSPRTVWPMRVEILEKHLHSTQVLLPMNADRYLVLVAKPGTDEPDLSTLRAFIATGRQGIAYLPGTWHHPLLALGAETDFSCIVWEDESEDDCTLVTLPESVQPLVELA